MSICILFEDIKRTIHLINYIKHNYPRIVLTLWDVSKGGILDLKAAPPKDTVFINRYSGSAWTRTLHKSSTSTDTLVSNTMKYMETVIHWLKHHNAKIIQGIESVVLESNKGIQCLELDRVKLKRPPSLIALGDGALRHVLTSKIKNSPSFIKPLSGGGGESVIPMFGLSDLKKRDENKVSFPTTLNIVEQSMLTPKQLKLVRSNIVSNRHNNTTPCYNITYRAEFVNKQFLYICSTLSSINMVSRCPCDERRDSKPVYFDIVNPNFLMPPSTFKTFIDRSVQFQKNNNLDMCAIEFVISKSEPIVIDVNMNTNYNEDLETKMDVESAYDHIVKLAMSKLDMFV